MNNAHHAIELLVAADQYGPKDRGSGVAFFENLGLFVAVREVQAMEGGFMALFISEINASPREGEMGVSITCVGMGEDMASAVADAVGQWAAGVLPVLAHWRGEHSCLSSVKALETRGGSFDLLAGPTLVRGGSEEGDAPPEHAASLTELLRPTLQGRRLAPRVHWLEMFASKSDDGSADATCRLNNRDWSAGQNVLQTAAAAWPSSDESLQTCRQFAMLLPKQGPTQDLTLPTFWDRVLGRA